MHIAIIGAGIAGVTGARQLQSQGHTVVIYEKSRGPGGRMNTRETELGGFDHGAQYFTATSDSFKKRVEAWRKAGWVAPWSAKLATLDHAAHKPAGRSAQRLVAVPGMSALAQALAQGVEVRTEHFVERVERHGDQWVLSVLADPVPIAATAGPFDAVLIALPADQTAVLLSAAPALAKRAASLKMAPCWSLMMGFQEALSLPYDAAWVENSRLGWICRDSSKPGRRPGEHWVAHASAAWSIEHLEDDPERAREKLLKAFHEATGSPVQPVYAAVHRWRYAQAPTPLALDFLWDEKLRIGACGDWFAAGLEGAGKVENAVLSADALARAVGK
jgi:renalase